MKYKININTGTAWSHSVITEAKNLQEAIDNAADEIEAAGYGGLYKTYDEFLDKARERDFDYRNEAEVEDEADRIIEGLGYICAGNHGIYLIVDSYEEDV